MWQELKLIWALRKMFLLKSKDRFYCNKTSVILTRKNLEMTKEDRTEKKGAGGAPVCKSLLPLNSVPFGVAVKSLPLPSCLVLSFAVWLNVNVFLWQRFPCALLDFVLLLFWLGGKKKLSICPNVQFLIGSTNEATESFFFHLYFLEAFHDSNCFLPPFFALPTLVLALSREGWLVWKWWRRIYFRVVGEVEIIV